MKRLDNQIIEYISGEMDDLDRIAFEQLLETDPDLKIRVVELQSTQSVLGNWNDEVIDIPEFEMPVLDSDSAPTKVIRMKHISPWYKYAASAAAIVGLLWISGLQVNTSNNSMTLSFGSPAVADDNLDERINVAVSNALEKYNANQTAQLEKFSSQIGSEIEDVKTSVLTASNEWKTDKTAVQVMMNKLSAQQYAKFETILKDYQSNQGSRMDESFADLMEYIDDKRIDDLHQIHGAFTEIVAAIDEQKERTDEIFQGIVQPVATNY